MSRNLFGWSYPPGCSGPPDDGDEFVQPQCKKCNSFISLTPTSARPWESYYDCNGEDSDGFCGGPVGKHKPHRSFREFGVDQIVVCKRCKTENVLKTV